MGLSVKASDIHERIHRPNTKMGELRKIAKEVKKDHELAMELWSTKDFFPRQLAILIMDKKLLIESVVDKICEDIREHVEEELNNLADWFMANQLNKDKKLIAILERWQHSSSPVQRRIFYYHQATLRWMGQEPADNSEALLDIIEKNLMQEQSEVQWAMNFLVCQIGVHQTELRQRCIQLGESSGLYRDDVVAKNCTPSYIPEFVRIEAEKWKK